MRPVSRIVVSLLVFAISFGTMSYYSSAIGGVDMTHSIQATESACEGQQCLLPTSPNNDAVNITKHAVANESNTQTTNDSQYTKSIFQKNYFLMLSQFWILGLLLGFTPCVLPLIILMVAFLGGQNNDITRKRMILFAFTYVISLACTYAILGVVIASGGSYLQAYFQQPWVIASASILIFLLSLSLLGFYTIKLPDYLQRIIVRHNKFQSNYQFIEIIIMGVLATLIASPCIAAPLAIILGYIGSTGNVILGGLALFFVGMGVGTPLILASIFNKEILPSPGKWQYVLRTIFALLMMCVALWLSATIIPHRLNMVLWSVLIVFSANYMWEMTIQNVNINILVLWRSLSMMLLVFGMAIFVGHLFGNINPFNPLQINWLRQVDAPDFKTVSTIPMLDEAISQSVKAHKPIFILFTADWCVACKNFHENVLNTETISAELKKFSLIKVDLTVAGSSSYEIARKYKVPGAPFVILFDEQGNMSDETITGEYSISKLYNSLRNIQHQN